MLLIKFSLVLFSGCILTQSANYSAIEIFNPEFESLGFINDFYLKNPNVRITDFLIPIMYSTNVKSVQLNMFIYLI